MKEKIRVGIDIGSVTIGAAVLEGNRLVSKSYRFHHGDIRQTLADIFKPLDISSVHLGLTGRGTKSLFSVRHTNDIVAAVEGVKWACGKPPRSILVAGGENIALIRLNEDGSYRSHDINTDCASGTGVFLDQQASRLGLSIERLSGLAGHYNGSPPAIATRCAVFAKTDLIHSQQKGHSQAAIAAGLCEGVALSLAETIIKDEDFDGGLIMVGGVALNKKVVSSLEKILKREIEVPPHAEVIAAIGAAMQAEEIVDLRDLQEMAARSVSRSAPHNPPLLLEKSSYPAFEEDRTWREGDVEIGFYEGLVRGQKYQVYLGIDIGSTSTKLVLAEEDRVILGLYTYTQSAPIQAVQRLFKVLSALAERFGVQFSIIAAGTTGSGRELVGKLIHADIIINEITAHARAALAIDPDVDTVIEIGGQDSKFIRVQNGAVIQAIMNYVCAAGTGSFIEEQARRLDIELKDYARQAMGRSGPVISDRCTVYMERDLSHLLADGWPKEELMASVMHSIRDNYLMRVVGQAKIGEKICFQGATAKNKALVAAFEVALGKPIQVSRICHLAGAWGVCLLLREKKAEKSSFVGLDFSSRPFRQETEVCAFCRNHCQIAVVHVGEGNAAWGFMCGRELEDTSYKEKPLPFEAISRVYEKARYPLKTANSHLSFRKEKIGIPMSLPLVEYLPLWEDFFSRLGFETVISPQEKDMLKRGKRVAQAEFCAPIALAHGHVDWLRERNVDFIFLPIMLHGPKQHEEDKHNFFCYYTSYAPVVLKNSQAFKEKKKWLSPLVDFQADLLSISRSLFHSLGRPLSLAFKAILQAFTESWNRYFLLEQNLTDYGKQALSELEGTDAFAVVLLGRPYNLLDRHLNQGLPDLIQQYGVRVLTQDMLDLSSVSLQFAGDLSKRVHWHYGKTILKATEVVLRHPKLFPVYITNFRCSPDAFITTYFRELMERQGKPYLVLLLDELSSDVGYQTRIEAALESFRNWRQREPQKSRPFNFLPITKDKIWIVPHLDDAATLLSQAVFRRFGYEAVVSEETTESIVQGLKLVGGGECVPVGAIVGDLVETVRKHKLDPAETAAIIPTSMIGCNFPQIPLVVQSGLRKAGLGDLEIFTTALANQSVPVSINLLLLRSTIMASLLHQMTAKIRPYEVVKGEAEKVKKQSLDKLCRTIIGKKNLLDSFRDVVEDFSMIKVSRADDRRPLLVILGDLYVVCNSTFNLEIEKTIEAAGGEARPSTFIDMSYYGNLNEIEKQGKNKAYTSLVRARALDAFVRFHDLRFRRLASPVLGGIHPLIEQSLLKQVRELGIPPELTGETAQNVLEIFYYIHHFKPDGFVHINPLHCCPGLVSSAIFHWVEEHYNVPVIHLFYDGIHSPNENLEPYIYYLKEKKAAAS